MVSYRTFPTSVLEITRDSIPTLLAANRCQDSVHKKIARNFFHSGKFIRYKYALKRTAIGVVHLEFRAPDENSMVL